MLIDLDPRGHKVVIFGDATASRQCVRRFVQAGALVTLAADPAPDVDELPPGVRAVERPAKDDTAALLRLIGPAWLIVDIDMPSALRERTRELARHLHTLMIAEAPAPAVGQVTLVGGGPGTPALLTRAACEALSQADVVFYDRLAPTAVLEELAAGAELVDVGKSPYHHPVSQRSIEELMVARALAGEAVVRFKGGDPFVFGRGGEEMLACLDAGIPVRVVSGVSSALSVPAAHGIPVTHRGTAKAFTVISGHVPPEPRELDALVRLGGTIVVLMGLNNLNQIVTGLLRAGLDAQTPAAVIEKGFSAAERSVVCRLGQLPGEVRRLEIDSPAVVVVGDVVAVSPEFAGGSIRLGEPGSWVAAPQAKAS